MILFPKPDEPENFNERVRIRGIERLVEFRNRAEPPTPKEWTDFWKSYDYWTEFGETLDEAFSGLCSYTAMLTNGSHEVDHFTSKSVNPDSAYEWTNYRNTTGSTNRRKNNSNKPVLDPFEVELDWFEVNPFTGEICLGNVPESHKERAQNSISVLGLDSSRNQKARKRIAQRGLLPKNMHNEEILECIRDQSPLVAHAVNRFWNLRKDEMATE